MGKNHTKSAANSLHEMLVQYDLGFKFDAHDLEAIAVSFGHDYGLSAITGFLNRAMNKGMIKKLGTHKPEGARTTRALYELIDKIEWAFKPEGYGSYPGRNIAGNGRGQEELPFIENDFAGARAEGMEPKEEIQIDDHPMTVGPLNTIKVNNPEGEVVKIAYDFTDNISKSNMENFINEITPTDVADMIGYPIIDPEKELSLSEQIIELSIKLGEIAAQVMDYETIPVKSVSDFTTDELLEELKRRIK